jgi:tetratricopeptide (TPR) repeat protein
MKYMKRGFATLAVLLTGFSLYGQTPPWLVDFRDAVYGQNISIAEAERLFLEADKQAQGNLSGPELFTMSSRCEYLLGRVYQDHDRKDEAVSHFEKGISWAEKALAEGAATKAQAALAYEMIAANYGHLCMIKSTVWVMANGLKVEENAKKALQLDSRNAGALYLLASRWAFGPSPFGNPKRGITELEAILNGPADLQKDNLFNVYSALGHACMRLNRNQEALSWTQKSLDLYPTNKFALDLQLQIQQKLRAAR